MEKLKVLIVDDDPEVSEFMRLKLSLDAPHFDIAKVESARDCLEYLKENPVECILSDYQMAEMDGMELLKAVKAEGRDVPFIFITGQGNEEVAREAFKNGANDYFTKDIGFAHFPRIINSIEQAVKNRLALQIARDADEDLKEANRTLQAIFEASPLSIFVIDPDGIVKLWNQASERIFGWTKDEIIGTKLPTVPPHKEDEHLALRRKTMAGETITSIELQRMKKGGDIVDVSLSVSPIRNSEGRITGLMSVVADITESKKARERLEKSEKEKASMLNMLTHDLKSPLSVIYSFDEMASELNTEETARLMANIRKAAKRISSLVDDMLSLSRLESQAGELNITPVNLAQLLQRAIRDNEALAAEKEVAVALENGQALPRVYADGGQLLRAFGNLVANAVSYNKKGGRVDISCGLTEENPDHAYVRLRDTGEGIAEEDMPHLFEKYYRGKRAAVKNGAGLGLAIVKAAVDAHGGSLEVESEPGKGATFTVILPVKPGF